MSKGSSFRRGVFCLAWRGVKEALYSKVVSLLCIWIIDGVGEWEGLEA
jgi:hypothetical protein